MAICECHVWHSWILYSLYDLSHDLRYQAKDHRSNFRRLAEVEELQINIKRENNMPMGPGIYDELCSQVREESEAVAAIVIIIDGKNGNGFSVQSSDPMILIKLPELLQAVTDEIKRSVEQLQKIN